MGAGDRVPHRDGAEMRRRTAGIHPALRRPRRLHAGGDDQQPEDGRGDGIHRARPVPHDRVPPPGTRRVHRLRRDRPAVRGRRPGPLGRRHPATGRRTRCLAGQRPGLLRRPATGCAAKDQRPRPVHRGCGRGLLVPHHRAEPLPDPDRRPGRHAAERDRTAPVPPGAHPFHRDRPRVPGADHAHFRGGQPVYRIGRGLRGEEEPDQGVHARRRPWAGGGLRSGRTVLDRDLRTSSSSRTRTPDRER